MATCLNYKHQYQEQKIQSVFNIYADNSCPCEYWLYLMKGKIGSMCPSCHAMMYLQTPHNHECQGPKSNFIWIVQQSKCFTEHEHRCAQRSILRPTGEL